MDSGAVEWEGAQSSGDDGGGGSSYDEFDRAHRTRLKRVAVQVAGEPQLGEDILQDALRVAYQRWDRVSACDRPDLWVVKAIRNNGYHLHTGKGRRERPVGADIGEYLAVEQDPADRVDTEVDLERAVQRLRPQLRDVFVFRHVLDYTAAEVAEILTVPLAKVNRQFSQAKAELKVLMADTSDQESVS